MGEASLLRKRLFLIQGAVLALLCLVVAAGVSWPLYRHLSDEVVREFSSGVDRQAMAVSQWARRAQDLARQITSRTRIRQELQKYNQGLIPLDQLVEFSSPKLDDAMRLSKEMVGITRMDARGRVVISLGIKPPPEAIHPDRSPAGKVVLGRTFTRRGKSYLWVKAPIPDRPGNLVGTDVVLVSTADLVDIVQRSASTGQGPKSLGSFLVYPAADRFQRVLDYRFCRPLADDPELMTGIMDAAYGAYKGERAGQFNHHGLLGLIRPIEDTPWLIISCLSETELRGPMFRELVNVLLVVLAAYGLCLIGYWLALRPLSRRILIKHSELEAEVEAKTNSLQRELAARKQAETALAEERQRLTYIIEGTNAGTWEWNVQTGETVFNDQWARIIGYTLEELRPVSLETWIKFTHPEDLELSNRLLESHFNGETDYYECEVRMRHKDGDWVWVLDRGRVATRTPDGKPLLMSGTHQDITLRKRAEEDSQRLISLIENSREFIGLADLDGRVDFLNPAGCAMAGLEGCHEATGLHITDFVDPDNISAVTEEAIPTVMAEGVWFGENNIRNFKTGELVDVSIVVYLIKDPQTGQPLHLAAIMRDIRDRIKAEKALRESEKKYRQLAEESPVSIMTFDTEGRVTFVNDWHLKKFARQRHKVSFFIGQKITELPGVVRAGVAGELGKVLQGEHVVLDQVHFPAFSGGQSGYQSINAVPVYRDGQLTGGILIREDVTDRVQTELALRESEARLKEAQRVAGVGSWWYDPATGKSHWTKEMFRVLGLEPADRPPSYKDLRERINPDDRDLFDQMVARANEAGTGYDMELRLVYPSGGTGYARGICEAEKDASGRIVRLVGTVQNITERRRAEEALRSSEERNRWILMTALDGFWRVDKQGRLVEVNDAYCQMSGYERQELLGMRIADLEALHTPGAIADNMRLTKEKGKARFETQHRRKDGGLFDVDIAIQHLDDEQGGQYVCFLRDITERKRAEEELARSEETYRALAERPNTIVFKFDAQGTILFVNRYAAEFFGYTVEEMIGQKTTDLIHDEVDSYGNSPRTFWDDLLKNPAKYALNENENVCRDGRKVWISWTNTPIYGDEGQLVEIISTGFDATSRVETEKKLRESEDLFRRTFQTSPDSININRLGDGLYIDINEGFTRLTGYTRQEVIGRTSAEVSIWSDMADRQKLVAGLQAKGYVENLEAQFRRKDGSLTTGLMSARVIHLHGEDHIISITRDISELKRAEEEKERLESQLRQAQKMEALGTLAGGIAHDFNNILAAIIGYSELALDDAQLGQASPGNIEAIIRAGERARDLVTQILTFSRKLEPRLKPIDLNQVVVQTEQMLERTIPRMIDIELSLTDDLWLTSADPSQLSQVLMNLGSNAKDAMPDGGRIVIETANASLDQAYSDLHAEAKPGDYIVLTVSDTGQGMDRETIDQIFDPFFTQKEVGKGTGLGLATVYGIVKNHGGFINCYSELGQGTIFKIYLPAIRLPEPDQPKPPADQDFSGGGETILLVDDEEPLRELGSQIIAAQGYRIMTAGTGEEALEVYRARPNEIDLVILDINMPGMGGFKCLQELRAVNPQAKVIISSGYSQGGQLKDVLNSGVVAGFVPKPFSRAEMLRTIRQVLDG